MHDKNLTLTFCSRTESIKYSFPPSKHCSLLIPSLCLPPYLLKLHLKLSKRCRSYPHTLNNKGYLNDASQHQGFKKNIYCQGFSLYWVAISYSKNWISEFLILHCFLCLLVMVFMQSNDLRFKNNKVQYTSCCTKSLNTFKLWVYISC